MLPIRRTRPRLLRAILLAASIPLVACTSPATDASDASAPETPAAPDAWILVRGGAIWTDARASQPVEALLARGGAVVAVGAEDDVRAALPQGTRPRVIELSGDTAVPGLVDAHGHLFNLGAQLESVDLVGCASFEDLVERVERAARGVAAGAWILGRGWDQTRWGDGSFPEHGALSRVTPNNPVLLTRVDGHAALANRVALALAGLDRALDVAPAIEGGRVHLDPEGRPTGVLIDTAIGLVGRHVPAADEPALRKRALLAQEALLAVGLTGVHEMGLDAAQVRVLEALETEGLLRMRVVGYLWGNAPIEPSLLSRYPGERDRDPAARLRIVGAKLMLDGAMGSRGAALLEDYADAPGERGLLRMDSAAFARRLTEVADAGLQPATHAIGDRANRLALDAYRARMSSDPRFRRMRPRIEHAQLVAPEDLRRFGELGVVPSMQPTHCTSDMRWVEERVGPERARGAYAWRALSARSVPIAFGSDFPVERPGPLEGLYAAVTRQDRDGAPPGGWLPEERLDAREALAAFTQGAAYAVGEEGVRGRLVPGARLDLSVFDVDPLTAEPARLLEGSARLVVIDGRVEWTGR